MQTSTESEDGGILSTTPFTINMRGKGPRRYRFQHIRIITRYRTSLINLDLREVRAQTSAVATVRITGFAMTDCRQSDSPAVMRGICDCTSKRVLQSLRSGRVHLFAGQRP